MSRTGTANGQAQAGKSTTSVIGLSDLNRMRIYALSTLGAHDLGDDRKALKDLSDQRIKNWPNTVQAIRTKKEAERFEKFKREELERRDLETQEASYQAAEKKKLLDRSKKQMYYANDRVKAFHSKLLLSDALNERELQLEIQRAKKEHLTAVEGWHHEDMLRQCDDYDMNETIKNKKLQDKRAATQKVLRDQHDEFKLKHIEIFQEEILEGEIIKRKAIESEARARAEEEQKKIKRQIATEEQKKYNIVLKEFKRKEKEKEVQEDEKIALYAIEKQKEIDRRKAEEQRKNAEKLAQKQRMITAAEAKMKEAMSKEAEFLVKQKREAEEKQEAIEKQKEKRIKYQKDTMENNRQITLKEKERKEKNLKIENEMFQETWRNKNVEIETREKTEVAQIRYMNKELAKFHKGQTDEKAKLREDQFYQELKDAHTIKESILKEDNEFMSYAERCVKEWDFNGKSVTPMILELQKQKKNTLTVL